MAVTHGIYKALAKADTKIRDHRPDDLLMARRPNDYTAL